MALEKFKLARNEDVSVCLRDGSWNGIGWGLGVLG